MRAFLTTGLALALVAGAASAQTAPPPSQPAGAAAAATVPAASGSAVATDTGFTIGAEDVLGILFWRDAEMSGDVTVRPDGMITLPLVRDIKAAGLTPAELADRIQAAAREFITDATVTVVVRQMNSRKVFITGEVARPGAYPLGSTMTVMQLIAVAGGVTEFADPKKIAIIRHEDGRALTYQFNYSDVARGRKREQNIQLHVGDTVVVPDR
jgi:polysaccharide export outer membrane protein